MKLETIETLQNYIVFLRNIFTCFTYRIYSYTFIYMFFIKFECMLRSLHNFLRRIRSDVASVRCSQRTDLHHSTSISSWTCSQCSLKRLLERSKWFMHSGYMVRTSVIICRTRVFFVEDMHPYLQDIGCADCKYISGELV